MSNKFSDTLSILIISFYSLVILLSIDGFQVDSTINYLLNKLPSFFTPTYSFIFLTIIITTLNIIAFYLFEKFRKKAKEIAIPSFFMSLIIYFIIMLMPNLHTYLYEKYIFIFYNGIFYDNEERIQQVFPFIFKLLTIILTFSVLLITLYLKVRNKNSNKKTLDWNKGSRWIK